MRTSIDLPDPLFREVKALAAHRGITMQKLFRAALENELRGKRQAPRRITGALVTTRTRKTLNLTHAEIEDLLA